MMVVIADSRMAIGHLHIEGMAHWTSISVLQGVQLHVPPHMAGCQQH